MTPLPIRHRPAPARCALLLGLVLALGPAPRTAVATEARTAALGARGDFFTDDGELSRWYAGAADYGPFAALSSGRFDPSSGYRDDGGALVSGPGLQALTRTSHWGALGVTLRARETDADPGRLYRQDLDGLFSVVYARRIGHVAAAVSWSRVSGTLAVTGTDGADRPLAVTSTVLGTGLRADLGPRVVLDLAAEIRGRAQDPPPGLFVPADGDPDSWRSFGVRGRAFIDLGAGWAAAPMAEYIHDGLNLAGDFDDGAVVIPVDRDLVHFGVGADYFPDADRMLVLSAEWLAGFDNARAGLAPESPGGRILDEAWVLRTAWEDRIGPLLSLRSAVGFQDVAFDTPAGNDHLTEWVLSGGLAVHAAGLSLDLAVSNRPADTLTGLALLPRRDGGTWLVLGIRYGGTP